MSLVNFFITAAELGRCNLLLHLVLDLEDDLLIFVPLTCDCCTEVIAGVHCHVTFIEIISIKFEALGLERRGHRQLWFSVHNKTLLRGTRGNKIPRLIVIRIRAHGLVHVGDMVVRHKVHTKGLINRAATIPAPEDHTVQQLEIDQPVVLIINHMQQVHPRVAMPNQAYIASTVTGGNVGFSHPYELRR